MIVKKITTGWVTQTFDTDTGEYVSQNFTAGDQVDYEDDEGNALVGSKAMPQPEPYLPFDMVQPE